MGFLDKFKAIAVRIQNNQALDQFCQTNFGKSLSVLKIFKHRTEIDIKDLPIVLITRPRVSRQFHGNVPKKEHSIFLYCGFFSEDKEKAAEYSIELEELIEDAVKTRTTDANDKPIPLMPANSALDEGKFHPVYFFVMEVLVKGR